MKYLKAKASPTRSSYYQNKLYSTRAWRKYRAAYLSENGGICNSCNNIYPDSKLHLDHVKPIRDGGSVYKSSNLQILCVKCHGAKTVRETIRGRGITGGRSE